MRPQRRQPTRLHCPRDSPGNNTGVGCHFLLQCMKVKSESEVAQSCPTPSDPMDCSLPGSSVHGIFQARVLEWGAIAFSTYSPDNHLNASQSARLSSLLYLHLFRVSISSTLMPLNALHTLMTLKLLPLSLIFYLNSAHGKAPACLKSPLEYL